jgi:hypothetical protein
VGNQIGKREFNRKKPKKVRRKAAFFRAAACTEKRPLSQGRQNH